MATSSGMLNRGSECFRHQFLRNRCLAEQETHDLETNVKGCECRAIEAAEGAERSNDQAGVGGSLAETDGWCDIVRDLEVCGVKDGVGRSRFRCGRLRRRRLAGRLLGLDLLPRGVVIDTTLCRSRVT